MSWWAINILQLRCLLLPVSQSFPFFQLSECLCLCHLLSFVSFESWVLSAPSFLFYLSYCVWHQIACLSLRVLAFVCSWVHTTCNRSLLTNLGNAVFYPPLCPRVSALRSLTHLSGFAHGLFIPLSVRLWLFGFWLNFLQTRKCKCAFRWIRALCSLCFLGFFWSVNLPFCFCSSTAVDSNIFISQVHSSSSVTQITNTPMHTQMETVNDVVSH